MSILSVNAAELAFLQGGGITTDFILTHDWSSSVLSYPNGWPENLKQSLAFILPNGSPALLFWGNSKLFFCNDAFKGTTAAASMPVIGEPCALAWPNLTADLEYVFKGETTYSKQLNANLSPIRDINGNINGVLGICHDQYRGANVTASVSSQHLLHQIVAQAPFPIGVYVGREMRIAQANQAIIEVWGKGPDVIGKTYSEILPELKEQLIFEQLDNVFTTGKAFHVRHQKLDLTVNGKPDTFYFNYSFTPLYNEQGNVYAIMNTGADVTDLVTAKQQVELSERNFRSMILQAPVAMCLLLGPSHEIISANAAMLKIWGTPADEVIGKPVFEALPNAREPWLEQAIAKVYLTGEPYHAVEHPLKMQRNGNPETVYQNFVCQPYRGSDGKVMGILAISIDVTAQVIARRKLERLYKQVSLAKEAAELGTFDMDLATGELEWDARCRELFGIKDDRPIDFERDFVQGLHLEDRARVLAAIDEAVAKNGNGEYDIIYRTLGADDEKLRWIRAKGKVYYDEQGSGARFIGSVLDVTDQKYAELRSRIVFEKQARLAAIVDSSDDIIISKQLDGTITSWNASAERTFGYTSDEAIGQHISLIIPQNRLSEENFIISRIKQGNKVDHFDTTRKAKNGAEIFLSITVSPIVDEQGNVIGASKIARDISAQVEAKEASRRYTQRLEVLNMVIEDISEELDLNNILQKVTDATTQLTGAKFGAFFYNKTDEHGNSYLLYTLSGASKEAFEKFGMPRDTMVFHPTFSGEGVVRLDDVTKDPRYGKNHPHQGMPKGHLPVVSYLAVPVISRSGRVIGGLFFGHPKPAIFTAEHESLVTAIAAQAAIGIDNALLYQKVRELNDKKDEFIGLASHELKTPLASINGYLQILNRLIKDLNAQKFLGKASMQVRKLTSLVNDLLDVSKIEAGKLKLTIANFDLREVVDEAIELIRNSTESYEIILAESPETCRVNGDSQRIEQVVINLLSNAIKYSPGANRVEVKITQQMDRVLVAIKDQGLGIAEDKIGNLFSRFYRIDEATPNISGLGIGLYLSHEIIARHQGNIWVESQLGKGSTFWFSLPL
ncbi:PAS domain-containing sensor histidine kinase [Pedobacter nanyangensis]|uniref:PAS domain-containing sensor histidine kinase n=1 Tax=Pedobacter nanyangensis TaxID=1562389 RepID=UPI000DE38922|nr:PAS domain S-box protein [Pedobacter nanyangensis]